MPIGVKIMMMSAIRLLPLFGSTLVLLLLWGLARAGSPLNYYQLVYDSPVSRTPITLATRPNRVGGYQPATTTNTARNIFNDRATILYKPQTSVILNDGQEKEGDCPITRPASGYSTFKQYEGLWFKRYRSRVRPGEPFFKCAWIDYIDQGDNQIFIMDNLQNNQTGEWARQNATSVVWATDPATWTSTLASGAAFDTHLIHYDGNLGVAVIYSCSKTANGHQGIGNIYTRSPNTPLPKQYVDFLLDIFYQNGIYDVLPLHFVDQSNCADLPRPRQPTHFLS